MSKKGLVLGTAVAALCAAAMVTLITWPLTDSITWKPLSVPAWWQFEWLAGLGVVLSAIPSFVIYKLDAFFAANEHFRNPVLDCLLVAEIAALCLSVYGIVVLFERNGAKAQQSVAADRPKTGSG